MDFFKNRKIRTLSLTVALMLTVMSLFAGIPGIALADAPGIPQQFYGAVTINGSVAFAGYVITAKVNGVDSGTSSTDSQGRYGYSAPMNVTGSTGAQIDFYINTVKAAQSTSFASGSVTRLDLTFSGTATPGSTTTPLAAATSSLPGGTVGSSYSASLQASGGSSPYNWTVINGGLPAGLALSSTGAISGTPSATGTAGFTVQVTDGSGGTSSKALSIEIGAAAAATTPAPSTTPAYPTPTTSTEGGGSQSDIGNNSQNNGGAQSGSSSQQANSGTQGNSSSGSNPAQANASSQSGAAPSNSDIQSKTDKSASGGLSSQLIMLVIFAVFGIIVAALIVALVLKKNQR